MKNTFSSWTDEIAQIVYPTFIRPHLEFASSVWNPHLEYDSKTLESVQRRATLTKESQHLPYEERLKRLGLTDLKTRRERGDFIQIYKLVHKMALIKLTGVTRTIYYVQTRYQMDEDTTSSSLVSVLLEMSQEQISSLIE